MIPVLVLLFFSAASALPVSNGVQSINACTDLGPRQIVLTDTYTLPRTPFRAPSCYWTFTVPANFFAYVDFTVYGLNQTTAEWAQLDDLQLEGYGGVDPGNSSRAWPSSFDLNLQSKNNSKMEVELSVKLMPATPGKNVVKVSTVKTDGPSFLYYFQDLNDGDSIKITAQTFAEVKVGYGTTMGNSNTELNTLGNIFVYDSGTLIGTLYPDNNPFLQQKTNSTQLLLYVAVKPKIDRGAILVTDYSNIADLAVYQVQYVPYYYPGQTYTAMLLGHQNAPGAVVIIGDKDGSTPFDIRQIQLVDDPFQGITGGPASSSVGGPVKSRASAKQLNPARVPYHYTGTLNTFYTARGTVYLKVVIG